jgi:outer membrane protein TolC
MVPMWRAWPAIAAIAWPLWPAWAQTPPSSTESAELREARQRWIDANERVGDFPRGHIDLLQWERTNVPASAPAQVPGDRLTAHGAVRDSLVLQPGLFGPEAPNTVAARERHSALLAHITRVRQTWLDAVLARQTLALQQARSEVADSGAELGRRMVQAGNWSQARLLREQVTQARESVALLQARQAERGARERLAQALGLAQTDEVTRLGTRLPTELPLPPTEPAPPGVASAEARVLAADSALAQQRTDVARQVGALPDGLLRQHAQARTDSLAALPADGLPVAALVITDNRLSRLHALGEAAEAQAALTLAESARRSQAREAWGRLQDQHALAHQTHAVLLPLVSAQEQETLLRYNGMLQSTWELLEATRERITASAAAAQARHGYWTALLDWQLLLAGGPYRATDTNAPSAPAATATKDH